MTEKKVLVKNLKQNLSSGNNIYKNIAKHLGRNEIFVIKSASRTIVKVENNDIYVINPLNNKEIKLSSKEQINLFLDNLKDNYSKLKTFYQFPKSSQGIIAYSCIDPCGLIYLYIEDNILKSFKDYNEIKTEIFRNILFLINYHNEKKTKFTGDYYSNNVCPGCFLCDTVIFYGKLLNSEQYNKTKVASNILIPRSKRVRLAKTFKSIKLKEIPNLSAYKLLYLVPHIVEILNYEYGIGGYAKIIDPDSNNTLRNKIGLILKLLIDKNIVKVHKLDQFGKYVFYTIDYHELSKSFNLKNSQKISVIDIGRGDEKIFNSINEVSEYYGYSIDKIKYHLNKLKSPLNNKIMQTF